MMFPKSPRVKDKAHLKRVSKLPCYICGLLFCDAHHLMRAESRGMAYKTGDDCAIPLCRNHHSQLHNIGEDEFFALYGKDYDSVVSFAKALYSNKKCDNL